MLNLRPVLNILGWISCAMAVILLVPAVVDVINGNPEWRIFVEVSGFSMFVGGAIVVATHSRSGIKIDIRQAFLITILGWIVVAAISALPFLYVHISFSDAVFESMSAITTTGSTVLVNIDQLPNGILLWRAILQWFGGIGIIAIATLILPLLRVGGMQLFKIESSDTSEEKVFTALRTIIAIFTIYAGMTIFCAILFSIFGMSSLDATVHAMTTLSTGGYSNHDNSFAYFSDLRLHWVATIFMAAGAIPFILYIRSLRGNLNALINDQQVRGFLLFLLLSSLLMAIWLMSMRNIDFVEAFTLTSFNITSVVTTTGFVSDDYTAWGPGAIGIFVVLMFVGGCSGSTSGAIKIYRHQILFLIVRVHIQRLFSPNRVIPLRYNGKALPDDVPYSILSFMAVFVASIALFTVLLSLMGLDIITAYSASITAVTNVGPGIGDIIGPVGNFSSLPVAAKWLLTVAMLAGRLEILALLVAFEPDFWK